jgi:hypothetical protein
MIVSSASDFLAALEALGQQPRSAPAPKGVLMVEPDHFTINRESAEDNRYMAPDLEVNPERARTQFRNLVRVIEAAGVPASVFPGDPQSPDDIFPNNVFATTPGRLIVGSMLHPVRQREAGRIDIRDHFTIGMGYQLLDLSGENFVAELTGSLVIDHGRRIGFCGMSQRMDREGARAMQNAFGLDLVYCFDLVPEEYHTNVILSVLAGRACVLYPGAFSDPLAPTAIAAAFPHRSLLLSEAEKNAFAGNCIALTATDLFMSQAGFSALSEKSREAIDGWGFTLHTAPLDEIEKAGGSLRCLLAEIF